MLVIKLLIVVVKWETTQEKQDQRIFIVVQIYIYLVIH